VCRFRGRTASQSIWEFERPITPDKWREILRKAPGVKLVDNAEANHFPMPLEASGQDDVLVGPNPAKDIKPDGRPRNRAVRQRRSNPQRRGDECGADWGEAD